MIFLLGTALLFSMIGFIAPVAVDESPSKPTPTTKDPKAVIIEAGTLSGTITKLDDVQISLNVSEKTSTPGPNKTTHVNSHPKSPKLSSCFDGAYKISTYSNSFFGLWDYCIL